MRRLLSFGAKLVVSGALFYLLWTRVDPQSVGRALSGTEIGGVALALLVLLVRLAAWGERFRWLLARAGAKVSRWFAARSYLIGSFASLGLPTIVGGDVVRGYVVFRRTRSGVAVASVVLFERATGLAVAFVLVLILAWSTPLLVGSGVARGALTAVSCFYLVLYAVALSGPARRAVVRVAGRFPGGRIGSGAERLVIGFGEVATDRAALAVTAAWSLIGQVLSITAGVLVARAVGIDAPAWVLIPAFPIVWLSTMLPVSLGGIGLREGAFVVLLAPCGVVEERGLALGLVMSLLFLAQGALGGVAFVFSGRGRKPGAVAADDCVGNG